MRKCIALAVVLLVFGGVVFAQEAEGPRERPRRDRGDRGDRMADMRQRLQEQLGLTEDQQKQFRQIMETHRQALENWQKENGEALRELQKQMREAMEAKDKDKVQSIREKMNKLFEGRRELQEGLTKRLGDVLTAEQMAKYKASFGQRPGGPGGRPGMFRHPIFRVLMFVRRMDLTEQQQEKIKKTLDQAVHKILQEVLTPEQQKRLKELEKQGGGLRPGGAAPGGGGDRPRRGGDDRPRRPGGGDRRPRGGNPEAVEVTPDV